MTVIAEALSLASPGTYLEIDVLKQLVLFCGAALLVSLILMAYGLGTVLDDPQRSH